MEAPFVYGRIADDLNFTDRKNEVALLTQTSRISLIPLLYLHVAGVKHLW